jgi:hypothetical protein
MLTDIRGSDSVGEIMYIANSGSEAVHDAGRRLAVGLLGPPSLTMSAFPVVDDGGVTDD